MKDTPYKHTLDQLGFIPEKERRTNFATFSANRRNDESKSALVVLHNVPLDYIGISSYWLRLLGKHSGDHKYKTMNSEGQCGRQPIRSNLAGGSVVLIP